MTAAARTFLARRPWWVARGALVALVAAAFADLLRGRVLFERDIIAIYWGMLESFARSVAAGSPPLWNPWMGFGQPMLANPSSQALYPPTWLSLALRPEDYYSAYAIGHLLLSSLGVLALARTLGLGPPGALVAAATWTLSGPTLSYVSLREHLAGIGWMPWVILAAERAGRNPSVARGLLWGAITAVQVVTGSLDVVLMTAGIEALFLARHLQWRGSALRSNLRLLGVAGLAAGLAVGLTAAQWLPTLELVRASVRTELSPGTRAYWSLRPLHLVQWLVPLFPHDLPLRPEVRQYLYEGREPFLKSHYLGLAALPLALAAFHGPRRRAALALGALLALSAALALGRHGLVYPLALAVCPPLGLLRYPPKVAILGAFAFAFLAGLGFECWRSRPREDRGFRFWTALLSLLAVVIGAAALAVAHVLAPAWLAGVPPPGRLLGVVRPVAGALGLGTAAALLVLARVRPPLAAGLAGALAIADLLQAHAGVNPAGPRALFVRTPATVSFLQRDGVSRAYTFDYMIHALGAVPRRLAEPEALATRPWAWRAALTGQQYPPSFLRWGIRGSYEADPFSLEIPQRRSLWMLLVDAERRPADHLRLLQLGGVTHVLARHRDGLDLLAPAAKIGGPDAVDVHVFRVPGTLPWAFLTSGVRVASGAAAYRVLLDPAFDPRRELVLGEGQELPPGAGFHGEVRLQSLRPDRLRFAARLDESGHLVVLEGYDRGWRAFVDGDERPLLRANAAFRAVALTPGEHVVEMVYRPRSVPLGFAVSLGALIAGLLAWGVARRRRPSGPVGAER